MKPTKIFRYFILPMLAILFLPSWTNGQNIDATQVLMAIFFGGLTGCIRCLWDGYQNRKQKIDY